MISESNPGTSILLEGTLRDQIATLNWTPYETYDDWTVRHILSSERAATESSMMSSTVGPEPPPGMKLFNRLLTDFSPDELQYKVLAVRNQREIGNPGISVSNIVSVAVETDLQVPSAFTPGSNDMNFEFKPMIDFAPKEYILIVY